MSLLTSAPTFLLKSILRSCQFFLEIDDFFDLNQEPAVDFREVEKLFDGETGAEGDFLLDESENPGPHELHMLLLDRIADHTCKNLPKNFNRYLVRGVEPDVVRGTERALSSECFSIGLHDYEMFGPPDVDAKE